MSGKHTPGPWVISTWPDRFGHIFINAASGLGVAETLPHDEKEANARLIAAAPEMRDALSDALDSFRVILDQGILKNVAHLRDRGAVLREDTHEQVIRLRALLARIDGEENAK